MENCKLRKGRTLENIISNNNLCFFDTKFQTYLGPSSTYTTIESVTLRFSSISPRRMYEDTCKSNHFPIVIENLHLLVEGLP